MLTTQPRKTVSDMARYIEETEIYKLVEPHGTAKVHCSQIDELPRADVAPKSEVEKIFAKIEDLMREWFDFFRQDNDIRESCAIMAALSQITELKKKYTEGKEGDGNDV